MDTGRESLNSSTLLKEIMGKSAKATVFLPMKELRQRAVRQFIVCHSQNLKKPMLLPHIYLIQCLNITTRFTPLSSHSYPVVQTVLSKLYISKSFLRIFFFSRLNDSGLKDFFTIKNFSIFKYTFRHNLSFFFFFF